MAITLDSVLSILNKTIDIFFLNKIKERKNTQKT